MENSGLLRSCASSVVVLGFEWTDTRETGDRTLFTTQPLIVEEIVNASCATIGVHQEGRIARTFKMVKSSPVVSCQRFLKYLCHAFTNARTEFFPDNWTRVLSKKEKK